MTELEPDEIQEMLDHLLERLSGSILEFVESLDAQYTAKGYLTDKQQAALQKIYDKN